MIAKDRASERFASGVEDAIARVDAIQARDGLSDRDVEKAAGVSAGFLCKTRDGKNRDHRAAASVAKLRAWAATKGGAPAKGMSVSAAPLAVATTGLGGGAEALMAAIRAAKTYESLGDLIEQVMLGVADGSIEKGVGIVLIDAARERRQLINGADHDRAIQTLTAKARHLSPQEVQWLTDLRASKTPRSLGPDEAVPAPAGAGPRPA